MDKLYDLLTCVMAVWYLKGGGNRMRILEKEEDKKRGGWREFLNDGFRILCCALYVIRVIRSSRMSWTGHVAQKKGIKMDTNV